MDKFPKRADLLMELKNHGQNFIENSRNYETNIDVRFCHLYPEEQRRRLGDFAVGTLMDVPASKPLIDELNRPVFYWNGSATDPVIAKAKNSLINTSECFPPSLVLLASNYVHKGYGDGDSIYDEFVRKVGALFFCAATAKDYLVSADQSDVGLYFKDPYQADVEADEYVVGSNVFFTEMAKGSLPGFDIHDIAHHASQMALYGEFYQWMAAQMTDEVFYNPTLRRRKLLVQLVLLTTLEHSLVAADDDVQSFGCLNWQSPRKSMLATGVSRQPEYRVNEYPFGSVDFNRWSAIRAIASIYRGQLEAEQQLSTKLNWMADMGYGVDHELLDDIKPFCRYDYGKYTLEAARQSSIRVPATPEELFENCSSLLRQEFGS